MADTFTASRLRQHGHDVQQRCVDTVDPPVHNRTGLRPSIPTKLCAVQALMSATPHATAHVYSKFDFTKPCQKCALQNEHTARKIDRCEFVKTGIVG
ncbi:hypothetical protein Y032_0194g1432 [Ancylostoma ceylanicum]|uniref:Uncharacterized protein n=1 Tax=Ancylostoma ceylanicum TaxID=53326 RepID=A0A016SP68_9BILA|nr:hypothetical protein Y032_0194g1432 [Ancylostoma ceylanicum]